MAVMDIVETILDSLLAFVIRIGLWVFVAALAPTWVAVLVLIAIILIPFSSVILDDISELYQPVADVALALVAFFAIYGLFGDVKVSLALVALFGLPLVYNVYL